MQWNKNFAISGMIICVMSLTAQPSGGADSSADGSSLIASATVPGMQNNAVPIERVVASVDTDENVARCDQLASGYAFRDVLDARGHAIIALEDIQPQEALAACGDALVRYPNHLRSKFHYARALEASSFLTLFPKTEDPEITAQVIPLYDDLCAEKVAMACHNAAGSKLRNGLFDEAAMLLKNACRMDKTIGAGASCQGLGQMYENGQIGQKKTLTAPLLFMQLVAD